MPDCSMTEEPVASQIVNLDLDAIPGFIFRQTADKTLSVTMAELNRQVLYGGPEEREAALDALNRLGFVHQPPA
ncbi:MAG: hypothetical protein AAF943_05550 [Pseudomonadota bacterium]